MKLIQSILGILYRVFIRPAKRTINNTRRTYKSFKKRVSVIGMEPYEVYEKGIEFSGSDDIRTYYLMINTIAWAVGIFIAVLLWVAIIPRL